MLLFNRSTLGKIKYGEGNQTFGQWLECSNCADLAGSNLTYLFNFLNEWTRVSNERDSTNLEVIVGYSSGKAA